MLMTKESRPAIRTLRGWAISVLQEAGAIRECEEHGWMQEEVAARGCVAGGRAGMELDGEGGCVARGQRAT